MIRITLEEFRQLIKHLEEKAGQPCKRFQVEQLGRILLSADASASLWEKLHADREPVKVAFPAHPVHDGTVLCKLPPFSPEEEEKRERRRASGSDLADSSLLVPPVKKGGPPPASDKWKKGTVQEMTQSPIPYQDMQLIE